MGSFGFAQRTVLRLLNEAEEWQLFNYPPNSPPNAAMPSAKMLMLVANAIP